MKYIIRFVLNTAFQIKWKIATIIVCMSLGLLIGSIFICQGIHAINSYKTYKKYIRFDNIIVIENYSQERIGNTDNLKKNLNFIKEIYGFMQIFENIVIHNKKVITGTSIYATDAGYDIFFNDYPITGKWFQDNDECIIGYNISKKYNIKLNDKLIVGDNTYRIAGILNIEKFSYSIFIPDKSISENKYPVPQDYFIFSNDISGSSILLLNNYLSGELSEYNVKSGMDLLENERNNLKRGWGPTIIISVISFLYGIVNVINIEIFYFMKKKNTYGILLAYGATYFLIFMSVFLESSILAIASSVLTYILVYIIHLTPLVYVISMKIDIVFFFIIVIIGQVYSLLYALYVTGKMKKYQISDIFRDKL